MPQTECAFADTKHHNPSQAYGERWVCARVQVKNRLGVRVEAAENRNTF